MNETTDMATTATPKKAQRSYTPHLRVQSVQELVQRNRKAGRLQPKGEQEMADEQALAIKQVLAGMRLWPEELQQAQQLAIEDERSASVFMRRVYLRGLQVYMQEREAVAKLHASMASAAALGAQGAADAAIAA